MKSNPGVEPLDLDRGLPTSADDVAMQRRLRHPVVDRSQYREFLMALPQPSHDELRRKPGPSGPPFRL
jgi:hypothetical protein